MEYRVCLEEMDAQWIAHVPTLLGCFNTAATREAAVEGLPAALVDYYTWRREHGDSIGQPEAQAIIVDEIHRAWSSRPEDEVNAFFAADAAPLTAEDAALALRLLEWSRADLLSATASLSDEQLSRSLPGQTWPVEGILLHVAIAEGWYMDRIGFSFPREALPNDLISTLTITRAHFRATLPHLAGMQRVRESEGELWSPRKAVRRAVWHERDHIQHILRLRETL